MSLLASFLDTRTTRAAVVVAVVLHALVLFGLVQYGRLDPVTGKPQAKLDTYQPVTVVFVAQGAPTAPVASQAPVPVPRIVQQDIAQTPTPLAPVALASREPATDAARTDAVASAATQPVPVVASVASKPSEDTRPDGPPLQAGKPDYAYNPQPDYPMLLREQGVGGVVWLRVWVDSDGHPGEIKLAKGSGYRLLDDAALRAVRLWRFVPAKQGAQSLASWVEFPIRFTLNG
jgi:protein TonB